MPSAEESSMATISRYEFMGSWLYFWLFCITGVGIPLAVLYLLNRTQVDDGERAIRALRAGR